LARLDVITGANDTHVHSSVIFLGVRKTNENVGIHFCLLYCTCLVDSIKVEVMPHAFDEPTVEITLSINTLMLGINFVGIRDIDDSSVVHPL